MQGTLQREEFLLEITDPTALRIAEAPRTLVATRADACLGWINSSKEVSCLLML